MTILSVDTASSWLSVDQASTPEILLDPEAGFHLPPHLLPPPALKSAKNLLLTRSQHALPILGKLRVPRERIVVRLVDRLVAADVREVPLEPVHGNRV